MGSTTLHQQNPPVFNRRCRPTQVDLYNGRKTGGWVSFYGVLWEKLKHTHPFNGPFSGTTQVSRYKIGKTNLDFTEARDSEWQWHQLGHMQVCTLLQTDNHASSPPLCFYRPDALPATQPTASKHWRDREKLKVNRNITHGKLPAHQIRLHSHHVHYKSSVLLSDRNRYYYIWSGLHGMLHSCK